MTESDQYLWVHTKSGFERAFYVKMDQEPYYFGNNKFEILNFRPSDPESNLWLGDRDGCFIQLAIIESDSYLRQEYPQLYILKQKYPIKLASLEINQKKINDQLYVIGDLPTVEQINQKIKKSACVIL